MSKYYRHVEWKAAVLFALIMFGVGMVYPMALLVGGVLFILAITIFVPLSVFINE